MFINNFNASVKKKKKRKIRSLSLISQADHASKKFLKISQAWLQQINHFMEHFNIYVLTTIKNVCTMKEWVIWKGWSSNFLTVLPSSQLHSCLINYAFNSARISPVNHSYFIYLYKAGPFLVSGHFLVIVTGESAKSTMWILFIETE